MKIHIKRSFDCSSESYDSSCDIQRLVAEALKEKLPDDVNGRILEIGTGTGLFTSIICEKYAESDVFCLDIAHSLLLKAKKHYKSCNYVCGDGENLPINADFYLITGSSSLQWFQNPEKSIPTLLSHLKNGGKFAFSVFVEGTFIEMSILNSMTGFGSVYSLPKADDFLECFKGYTVEHELKEYVLHFDTVSEFLKKQKGTGATFTGADRFSSKSSYKKFLELYPELFGDGGRIPVTYKILYINGLKA